METPKSIRSKAEHLNENLAKIDASITVDVSDDADKLKSSLKDVEKYLDGEWAKREDIGVELINPENYIKEFEAQIDKVVEEQNKKLDKKLKEVEEFLTKKTTDLAKSLTDFLPSINIPPVIENITKMVQNTKKQIEETKNVLEINVLVAKNNMYTKMIKDFDKISNNIKQNDNGNK